MKHVFTKAVAAIAIGSAALAAVPAEARHGRGDGYRGYDGWRGYDRGRGYGRVPAYRSYYGPRFGYGYGQPYGGYGYGGYGRGYYGYRDNGAGIAIGAGILGLALGAAIASDRNDDRGYYYDRGYYDRGYYDDDYYGW